MNRYLMIALLLAACGGEREESGVCPSGETCSAATPDGLDFVGNQTVDHDVLGGPATTAIGGTQDIELLYGGAPTETFDLAYTADTSDSDALTVAHTAGPIVTVRGAAAGDDYLRIVDPSDGSLYDRKQLSAAALADVTLLPGDLEIVPVGPIVFASGELTAGLALTDADGDRLVDTSAQLAGLDAVNRPTWDSLTASLVAGSYTLALTSGATTVGVTLDVVDGADAIAAQPVATDPTDAVCFVATNADRTVVGLAWTFSLGSAPATSATLTADALSPNCVDVTRAGSASGPVAITATAGGATLTQTFDVAAADADRVPHAPRTHWVAPSTAGERAAM